MLELLAYVGLILFVVPALLFATGKLIAVYGNKLSSTNSTTVRSARPPSPRYETLHQRLVAAAEANPLLPTMSSLPKGKAGEKP